MKTTVESTRFGAIEIDDQAVLNFPNGLLGLENCKRFTLLHEDLTEGGHGNGHGRGLREDRHTVHLLQSLDDPDVTLPVVDPVMFGFDYDLTLTPDESSAMDIRGGDTVAVLLVVSKYPEDRYDEGLLPRQNINANISGPILINTRSRIGTQKVLTNLKYNVTFQQGQKLGRASAPALAEA